MPSKAELIAARWAVALSGATAAGAAVYRDRSDALTREDSPAILIELVDEDSTPLGGGRQFGANTDQDELRLALIVCVRNASWQTVADQVRVQAHAVLAGDAEFLALIASWRRDRADWKPANADVPFGYCAQTYVCKYLTRAHALDQFA